MSDMGIVRRIGILGIGALGGAVAQGLLQKGISVSVFDTDETKKKHFASLGAEIGKNAEELCSGCDILCIAIKPNIFFQVLSPLRNVLAGKLCISLAGGVSLEALVNALPEIRWGRAMTNICAAVNRAFTGYVLPDNATGEETDFLETAFGTLGEAIPLPEHLFNAITAISGSGPAFFFSFLESFLLGGVRLGLPSALALKAASWTAAGSAELLLRSGKHPAVLRDEVSTPGGTTIEGITALLEGGVPASIVRCLTKTAEKSGAMSGKGAGKSVD